MVENNLTTEQLRVNISSTTTWLDYATSTS